MEYELIAAVDLGSNSFRLQVGRVVGNQIYPLDTLKEPVRLAGGLLPDKMLDDAAQARGLAALHKFGERLRGFHPRAVRAVATNTLRVAKNAAGFLADAEQALGFPIEVIAGREEARLIYLGVAHSLPPAEHKRLVVDIGGGSTEFIIGRGIEPVLMVSLYVGCVAHSMRYFPDGNITKKAFRDAEIAAAREIESIAHEYLTLGWNESLGSSGTAREIADVIEQNGFNPRGIVGITREGLDRLRAAMIEAGNTDRLGLSGLRADRIPVLPGGVAIMSAAFDALRIEHMNYGDGALRLGVLYDLLGRFHSDDMRATTVEQFMRRYQVDRAQAGRVEEMAAGLLAQIFAGGQPPDEEDRLFLAWAARLHEIGVSIAHNAYHKHGAYILTFADMPGFSKKEQGRLAFLVLGHRGKLERLVPLPPADPAWPILFSLRIAALFHRSRHASSAPCVRARRIEDGFRLDLPSRWLSRNTMTAAVLADEVAAWRRCGIKIELS